MQALRAHERGGPERFVVEEAPEPAPGPGEVQVAVTAAAITFDELLWDLSWTTTDGAPRTPVIPSHEFSGVVSAVGPGAGPDSPGGLAVGDVVYGMVPFDRDGAAAEIVVAPLDAVAVRPRTLDAVSAAALPLAGLTAIQGLVDVARLQPGERVLVLGGAGGVGSMAVQIAKRLGGHVTATVRGSDAAAAVLTLGADTAVDITTGQTPSSAPFDVILDTVGGAALDGAWSLLQVGGRLVTLQAPPDPERARAAGVTASFFVVEPSRGKLVDLAALVDSGALTVPVAATFALEKGREAFESGRRPGRRPGKTVLEVRPE
ncbi:NADP-dependent oxidoreductase [Xylanimonas sp. McL0601]|uniref:NADP-dependent oxidoreductase n=1 Tax=Xylanimonas sp. McL0601 TaxID=3414739 RepID=UPI003CF6356B